MYLVPLQMLVILGTGRIATRSLQMLVWDCCGGHQGAKGDAKTQLRCLTGHSDLTPLVWAPPLPTCSASRRPSLCTAGGPWQVLPEPSAQSCWARETGTRHPSG